MDQIQEEQPAIVPVLEKSLAAKMGCQAEVWRFCVTEVNMYLPKKLEVTGYFLGDLLAGRKKCKCP